MGWWVAASQRHDRFCANVNRHLACVGVLLLGTVAAFAIPAPRELPPEVRRKKPSVTHLPAPSDRALAAWPGTFNEYTPADLAFLRATVSEDPTQLTRRVEIGMLLPEGHAYVRMLVTHVNSAGKQVGSRQLVRRLRMPLEDFYSSVRAFDRGLANHVPYFGGASGICGLQQFVPGFAGFPERNEL